MFSKSETNAIKGVAILLMLEHHLFTFVDRIPKGVEYNQTIMFNDGISLLWQIGCFGKICVPIFMFLGGYAMYITIKRNGRKLHEMICNLYVKYWKVFVVFVPIGFLFFADQPDYCGETVICHVFSNFDIGELVRNFFCGDFKYNREWWFMRTYLCTSFLGYVYIQCTQKMRSFWKELYIVVLIAISVQNLWPAIGDIAELGTLHTNEFYSNIIMIDASCLSFFAGILFAKYDAISKLHEILRQRARKLHAFISIFGIIAVFYLRTTSNLDILLVPCLIVFLIDIINVIPLLKQCFQFLGKHSSNMWLIHSFYCYYFYGVVKIVCSSNNPWIVMFNLTLISLLSSVVLEWMYAGVNQAFCLINGLSQRVQKKFARARME